jgi:predicted enzyme related to lactoylglutathione lyase
VSIQIKEIAFVFHPITDLARARKFYEELLGLKVSLEIEFAPGSWWIEYDIGGAALAVCNLCMDPSGVITPSSSVTLEVADLDAALVAVKAANIPISQELVEFPPCRMFSAKDPDGNEIRFHQRNAAR